MASISVSSTNSADEEKEQLLGNGTKTRNNTNMDSTPITATQQADATRSLGKPKTTVQTEVLSCAGQQLMKNAVSSCWQKSMQRLTSTGKAGSPSAKYFNWSYRVLRRKQLLLLLAFVIFIVYLSSSMRGSDYADERIPVLHYSHVPGMKVSTNSILNRTSTSRFNKSVAARPLLTPPAETELSLSATASSTLELVETSIFDQTTDIVESFNDSTSQNSFTNDTYKIMRPPTGYLVWSESCRIPDVDVHAPDIMQHFKREKYKPCSNKKPLTTVAFNATSGEYVLRIEESEIKSFSKSGRINCCYQSIIRNGTGAKADCDYSIGITIDFIFSVLLITDNSSKLISITSFGDDCLSRSRVHEWFQRFQSGRETYIKDDQHMGQSKSVITGNSSETVRAFIKNETKLTLKFMEMELNISQASIYRILTEHLGLRKVCARLVPHKLTDDQKSLRSIDACDRLFGQKSHFKH